MQSGKRRCSASGMCALIVLAARKKRLLRDEHGHAAEWLPISVCKKKCMLLCTLASLNECVSVSTRRETSHIDRPLRLAARGSRTPTPCSAASASSAVRIYHRARSQYALTGSKGPGAIDRTRYGQLRGSTRSFRRHHLQQLVKAAVVGDSEAILRQITSLKQRAFGAAPAAAGGSVRNAGA